MENLFSFGLLTPFAIVCAFLADIFLAPALVTLVARGQAKPAWTTEGISKPDTGLSDVAMRTHESELIFKKISGESA